MIFFQTCCTAITLGFLFIALLGYFCFLDPVFIYMSPGEGESMHAYVKINQVKFSE